MTRRLRSYGTKKACEPVHVQLNLATYQVDVINTTTMAVPDLLSGLRFTRWRTRCCFRLRTIKMSARTLRSGSLRLDLAPYLAQGMVIVELELQDAAGKIVSQNLYWLGAKSSSYRELTHLAPTSLKMEASATKSGDMVTVKVATCKPWGDREPGEQAHTDCGEGWNANSAGVLLRQLHLAASGGDTERRSAIPG